MPISMSNCRVARYLIAFNHQRERHALLRWAQQSYENFTLIPPGMGICHQINLEYLSRCVQVQQTGGRVLAIPDMLVGTDSHTTMVNGLGVWAGEWEALRPRPACSVSHSPFRLRS